MAHPEPPSYLQFRPRPDQPERYDQQTSFFNAADPGVSFLIGGNGAGTSETALAKVAKFILHDQPPPRKDTPFWIIAESYEQVCNAAWKEKLFGHGHIPKWEVDWERVRWYKPNQNWPFEIPLKSWPGRPGKNWSLKFKSYAQGRAQMQAEAIGGFLFVEQFPWGLLEEVLRGCREYNYPGSKLCEFTPIDPVLSAPLEDLIDNDRLPNGWKIYRANTRCAVEAGHVSESWYDEFFGLISPEMRPVREIGAFASFEGAIYQAFNPLVHLVGDDDVTFPSGVKYRRAIDWGAGPDNAFVCLWGYKNGWGQWTIFDEYWSTDQNFTVHEHLKAIQDYYPWPAQNPDYGTTYADPSDPGNIRIASKMSQYCPGYSNMQLSPANNSVYEGIDYVRWALQKCPTHGQPRVRIHKGNCPNLVREMRTYRWMRGTEKGRNPTDSRGVPLKRDDHACTISSMPVLTKLGWKPIIDVVTGDIVASGCGWTRVLCGAVKTGESQSLVRVKVSSGEEWICTPDHQFATTDGMIPASQLVGRILLASSLKQAGTEQTSKRCSTPESNGRGISTLRTHAPTISRSASEAREESNIYTGEFTPISSGTFRRGCTSIIGTEISETTRLTTSNSSRIPSIEDGTATSWTKCRTRPLSGDARIQSELWKSQRQPAIRTGQIRSQFFSPAAVAGLNSNPWMSERTENGIALPSARLLPEKPESPNARIADRISRFTQFVRTGSAVESALLVTEVSQAGSDDTFCIATESGTMVWEGGILVSNCDALRYLLFSEANSVGATPERHRQERETRRGIRYQPTKVAT